MKNKFYFYTILFVFIIILPNCNDELPEPLSLSNYDEYGIDLDVHEKEIKIVKPNQNLGSILLSLHLNQTKIDSILLASKNCCDISKIVAGNKYLAYYDKQNNKLSKFIYQINATEFYLIDLSDSLKIEKQKRDIVMIERVASGKIKSSLYKTLNDLNIDDELAIKLAEIFAWEIDFYRLQEGDEFKVVYDEVYANGEFVRINNVLAAQFVSRGEEYFAFGFNQDEHFQYFNEEGKSLRKEFLQSPLKFSRITSGFSLKRYHPIQKRIKAHLGTDYAAPQGTPILAVGDGIVEEAAFKQFNGNYVKIRHNSTYTTQYLHMSKFAKGIRKGVHVSQGQVIGYVGSTGLATGPHVCFRFWKNNQQVDHRREKFPPAYPINKENEPEFFVIRDYYKKVLLEINNFEFQNDFASN